MQSHYIAVLLVSVASACGGKAENLALDPRGLGSAGAPGGPSPASGSSGSTVAASTASNGPPRINIPLSDPLVPKGSCPQPSTDAEPLCNGFPEVRLVVRSSETHKCTQAPRPIPLVSNQFLIVTGDCRFWASVDHMQGIREGRLSPDAAAQLAQDLQLHDFRECASLSSCDHPRVGLPMPAWSLAFGRRELVDCLGGSDPLAAARSWTQTLASEGMPSRGTALLHVGGPLEDTYAWPHLGAWPLMSDLAALAQLSDGTITPVTEPVELEALRTLRSEFVDEPLVVFYCSAKIRTDAGSRYDVTVIDELPPDVKQGLVRFDAARRRLQ